MTTRNLFLDEASALALACVQDGGRPSGAVTARDGRVIARGIGDITFAYSNPQAERFGLSTVAIAAELARPLDQQPGLSLRHEPQPVPDKDHLDRIWQRRPARRPQPVQQRGEAA